jgi:hypothetical protein
MPRDDTFQNDMDALVMLVRLAALSTIDLDFLDETVARAESVGPLLYPSAFVQGRAFENLAEQRELLELAAPFIRGSKKLFEKAMTERLGRELRKRLTEECGHSPKPGETPP